MKIKSFFFGVGSGLMLLSVFIYFFYSFNVKNDVMQKDIRVSDAEVVERARQLGMVTITEALGQGSQSKISDEDIIDLASQLGMVFPENAEPELGDEGSETLPDVYDERETGASWDDEEQTDLYVSGEPEKTEDAAEAGEPVAVFYEPGVLDDGGDNISGGAADSWPENIISGGADGEPADIPDSAAENDPVDENINEEQLILVDIAQGLNANEIALRLYNAGIIYDVHGFLDYLKINNATKRIVYGKYYFYQNEPYESILDKITL